MKTEIRLAAGEKKNTARPNHHIIEERICLAPYQCPSCKKLFYTTSDLDRHLNNATDCWSRLSTAMKTRKPNQQMYKM